MFTLKSAAILALIGSAFAAPIARRQDTPEFGRYTKEVVQVVPADQTLSDGTKVVYVVGTPDSGDSTTTTQANPYHHHGGSSTSSSTDTGSGTPTTDTSGSTDTSTGTTSASTGTTSGSASTGSSDSGDWLSVVNKWRQAGGLTALTQSSTLVGNAQKTVDEDQGTMTHHLFSGSFAQVLAPGTASNFEKVYVGGWLCERPDLPGLNGICSSMAQGWAHDGETGHADILTSTSYKSIGCALADGLWGCDLA